MIIEKRLLSALGVSAVRVDRFLPDLNNTLPEHQIDTPLRVAHFLSQVVHESGRFKHVEENMNYSKERLLAVFSKYFTPEEAYAYGGHPEKIGSRVYGSRMGNGNEATGDGYHYRGRGLIQLTGKNNYRNFSRWVGEDVVAQPHLVAERYAVHSAVFYWDSRRINSIADADDIRAVTKTVNGGLNGLQDRLELLDRAKVFLRFDPVEPDPGNATHTVAATSLNLRRLPRVVPSTLITSLPQGKSVVKVEDSTVEGWIKIRTVMGGRIIEGYVAGRYLEPVDVAHTPIASTPPLIDFDIPIVHLSEDRNDITRAREGGWAYPLGEPDRPRRTGLTSEDRIEQLTSIVNYLDSKNHHHLRYWPKRGTTYCNIYAYDYAYLAGVYLPRVWWVEKYLPLIKEGVTVPIKYGDTVRELNANMIHDWFEDYGPIFGWKRELHLDVLQGAANHGEACIIVAKRKDLNRSGHIVAVVPENGDFKAIRNNAGEVIRPLESQAGAKNYNFVAKTKAWWQEKRFQSYGFWRHT